MKIISFGNVDSVLRVAGMTNDSVRLFPNPSVNKMYYMEINSEFKTNDNVRIDVFMDGILVGKTFTVINVLLFTNLIVPIVQKHCQREHGWRVQLARCLSPLSCEVKPIVGWGYN